ncbi:RodZ domain-containing protein [Idiomarina aquatica]|nr:RodZ domain-containing protein [Idiomarina aquatica]
MTADNQSNDTEKNAVNNNDVEHTAEQQKEPVKGPGQLLKEAREAKNLTPRDVADRLRLRLQIIELLEADDYESFSTPTFIKGYLRSYAKLLDANEDEVFAAYKKLGIKEPDTTAMQSFSRRVKHQENDNRLMLITYAVIIVVIGLVIWWWQDSDISFNDISSDVQQAVQEESMQPTASPEQNEPDQVLESEVSAEDTSTSLTASDPSAPVDEQEPPQTVTDTESADTVLAEVNSSSPDQSEAEPESTADAAEQPQTVTNDADNDSELSDVNSDANNDTSAESATEPVADNDTQAATGDTETTAQSEQTEQLQASLVFEFSEECWVKVDDATGETQAVGIKAAGYTMPVPGEAPFSVTICKPEAVTISYQGQTLDLSNFRQARVARFDVPLDN